MNVASYLLFICFIAGLFSGGYSFERLLKTEYKEFRSDWEKDGLPVGLYWLILPISEFPNFGSFHARMRCFCRWLFISPEWVTDSTDGRSSLYILRSSLAMILVTGVVWLGLHGSLL
jgi:hypothetical protein